MCPGKERPAGNTVVFSRGLTRYGDISARQNRVCPCQSMVRRQHYEKNHKNHSSDHLHGRPSLCHDHGSHGLLSERGGAYRHSRQDAFRHICASAISDSRRRSYPLGGQAELAEARAKNPDAVAWLYIPGAEVDDPVMQAEDNGNYPVALRSAHERYLVDAPLRRCLSPYGGFLCHYAGRRAETESGRFGLGTVTVHAFLIE